MSVNNSHIYPSIRLVAIEYIPFICLFFIAAARLITYNYLTHMYIVNNNTVICVRSFTSHWSQSKSGEEEKQRWYGTLELTDECGSKKIVLQNRYFASNAFFFFHFLILPLIKNKTNTPYTQQLGKLTVHWQASEIYSIEIHTHDAICL